MMEDAAAEPPEPKSVKYNNKYNTRILLKVMSHPERTMCQ